MDIHVVGAGLLGLSSALSLAEAGHHVTVHEQSQPGAGASAKAAGLVSTMTWSDEEYRLIAETRGRIGELISLAMIEGSPAARHLWKPYPSIAVAKGESLATMDAIEELLNRNTEEPERMGWQEAKAEFPGIRFSPGEEILVAQEDGAVEAGDLVAVIESRCRNEDVQFLTGEVTDLAALDADKVVVAGGAWTKPLFAKHGVKLPVAAFRTQAATVGMADSGELPMVHDTVNGFYFRPESDESLLAGDGTQLREFTPDQYDEAADPEFKQSIAQRLVQRVKGAEEATLRRGWAGLVVGTPDRRPLCGAVPGMDDTFVLTGDNGFGLMRCLALGDRLADALRGRPDGSLAVDRFGELGDWEIREGFAW